MYREERIGIAIPAFNEELLINDTIESIPQFADVIYVVDDASSDNTGKLIKEAALKDSRIIYLRHEVNLGVGGAISTALKRALKEGIDIVCVMAGDNQMDSQYLPSLLDPIVDKKVEFTKGNRLKKGYWKGMTIFRLIGNIILTFLTQIVSGYWYIKDPQNGYVAISRSCLEKINLNNLHKGYMFENDLMIKANVVDVRIQNIIIPARYGEEKSKIKYFSFIFKTIFFFIKSFFWRIWKKYLLKIHPIGILYISGIILLFLGLVFVFYMNYYFLAVGIIALLLAVISERKLSKKLCID